MAEEREEERGSTVGDSSALRQEDELVWARDLTNHFVKTIGVYQTYPPSHRAVVTLQDQLMDKFRFFLEKMDRLTWEIAEYEIYYKDEIVYENADGKSSLASRFYREGLERIQFEKGLQEWEVVDFMDVIARADTLNPLEDDLITLLWEGDFQHIHYVAGEYHLQKSPIEFPEKVEDFRKALKVPPMPSYQRIELIREHGLDPGFPHQRLEGDDLEISMDQLRVQPEKMEDLKQRVDVETRPEFCFHVITTLFEAMSSESEAEGFGFIVSFSNRIIESLLSRGDFTQASQILRRLYIFLNSENLEEWQSDLIKKAIIEAGESSKIEIIGNLKKKISNKQNT